MKTIASVLLVTLPLAAAAQTPATPAATARPAGGQPVAAANNPVVAGGGLAGGASVAWIFEERFRFVHACVFTPADGGKIECWSKALNQSMPSR